MTTENRGYNLPEKGTTDWDEPLNENFEDIDKDVQESLDGLDTVQEVPLGAGAETTDPDLILYIGGTWVGSDDPAVEYPSILEDGHRWYDTSEL